MLVAEDFERLESLRQMILRDITQAGFIGQGKLKMQMHMTNFLHQVAVLELGDEQTTATVSLDPPAPGGD